MFMKLRRVTGSSTANYGAITGTANQLPFVNSGATGLTFGALSTLVDNAFGSTQGSVIYRGAATWTALSPGSAGQFLQTQGAGLNPSWAAAAGGGSVTSVTASSQGLTINGVGGAAGGSFNVSGTITPIQTINAQTGTTYTVLSTDHTKLVTFSNAAAVAVTLPQANGAGFNAGFWWHAQNIGTGAVTITPTTSTIDGATLIVLQAGQGLRIASDGTNYYTQRGVAPLGFNMPTNLALSASVGSDLLTVSVINADTGAAATGGSPILVPFRSATATSGTPSLLAITSTLSINTNATGATLGSSNSTAFRFWVVVFNDGGTARLALINCSTATQIYPLNESLVASATSISGSATAAGTFYCTNGVTITSKAFRIVGYVEYDSSGLGTAGTYASAPDFVQVMSPGVKKPGDVVQAITGTTSTASTTTSTSFTDTNLTVNITPTSAANLCFAAACGVTANNSAADVAYFRLARSTTSLAEGSVFGSVNQQGPAAFNALDKPNSASATTYKVQAKSGVGTSTATFAANNQLAAIVVQELMG